MNKEIKTKTTVTTPAALNYKLPKTLPPSVLKASAERIKSMILLLLGRQRHWFEKWVIFYLE